MSDKQILRAARPEERKRRRAQDEKGGMNRREAVKWMLSAVASVALLDHDAFGQALDPVSAAKGYGVDPALL